MKTDVTILNIICSFETAINVWCDFFELVSIYFNAFPIGGMLIAAVHPMGVADVKDFIKLVIFHFPFLSSDIIFQSCMR